MNRLTLMDGSKTILLTGGTGFLGSHLLEKLVLKNYRIILLKRSSSNTERIHHILSRLVVYNIDETGLEHIFTLEHIDAVLHCATNYGRKATDEIALLETNLILPLKLLKIGIEHGLRCFINTDTVLDKRISQYSLSKSQFKDWLKKFSGTLTCVNVALEHFYGPNDDPSKFVTFLIRQCLRNVPSIDLTEGRQKRDFIYIEDAVEAFMKIIDYAKTCRTGYHHFEIGSGRPVSVRKFAALVKLLTKNRETSLNFGAVPYRNYEMMNSRINLSRVKKLGWKPETRLEQGLARTIAEERKIFTASP